MYIYNFAILSHTVSMEMLLNFTWLFFSGIFISTFKIVGLQLHSFAPPRFHPSSATAHGHAPIGAARHRMAAFLSFSVMPFFW
jgi:hypothetical protein